MAKKKELINSPNHYVLFEYLEEGKPVKYEVKDYIKHILNTNPELSGWQGGLFFNVLKYISRTGQKDELVQELKKAQYYLNELIADIDKSNNKPVNQILNIKDAVDVAKIIEENHNDFQWATDANKLLGINQDCINNDIQDDIQNYNPQDI